ncbi:MAG TPA: 2-dehydropantoate 2-reductase [Acidimicrobiales bacterium]|nr:2-dehydropantoate 2-reductase [Acidimicrobiales bacterium]
MRFVVYGAGAVGGVVGGRLHQHGHDVLLIARGAHFERIRDAGLTLESAESADTFEVPVVDHPSKAKLGADDVVFLGMKSQHTADALDALALHAPAGTPVVCLQNGVANERAALRIFPDIYGICVMCPTTHLEPGVVQANSSPISGLLDIGRFPEGIDDTSEKIAAALQASTFVSEPRPDIMRWKYAKLLMNLGNAVQALCEWDDEAKELAAFARAEGEACLRAAGIQFTPREEDLERRGNLLGGPPIAGRRRAGGSTWQSLARGTGSLEVDYLNGEIVLLGRLHGVLTPVNRVLQEAAREVLARNAQPASMSAAELFARAA